MYILYFSSISALLASSFFGIEVYGLKRSFKPKDIIFNIKAVFKYLSSTSIVKKKIKEFNPDIVIGAGGYVTAPVIKAAKKLGEG